MKSILAACCSLPLLLSAVADAGINGTYQVRGNETADGARYTFTGTLKLSKYKTGAYSLRFNDGDTAAFGFTFRTPIKETTAKQTVSYFSPLGTGTATISFVKGKYKVVFNYRSKDGSVVGSGTGAK